MTDANRQIVRKSTLAEQSHGDESHHILPDVFVELTANSFRSAECYERRRVSGSLSGTTADEIAFDDGRFVSVDLSKTRWAKLFLRRTNLETCDLANAHWTKAVLDAVDMYKCRAVGFQLVDSQSSNSVYRQSKLSLAAFHDSKFHGDRFENCDLKEAHFEGAALVDVVFRNCDLRLARFPNCTLENIDFRGSQLAGLQVEPSMLRGACVDATQLPDLAANFGLVVKALEDADNDQAAIFT